MRGLRLKAARAPAAAVAAAMALLAPAASVGKVGIPTSAAEEVLTLEKLGSRLERLERVCWSDWPAEPVDRLWLLLWLLLWLRRLFPWFSQLKSVAKSESSEEPSCRACGGVIVEGGREGDESWSGC